MRYIFIILLLMPSLLFAADKIDPSQDLVYQGSFIIPATDGVGNSMLNAARAMTYDPAGNSGAGSLYITSNATASLVCEIAIPALVQSQNWASLNSATFIQTCADASSGKVVNSTSQGTTDKITGMAIMPAQGSQETSKLYMSVNEYFSPELDKTSIGWAELDLSTPTTAGWWDVGGMYAGQTSQYLCEIDATWATANLGGKTLGIGRDRAVQGGGTSRGPTLYATAPWVDGNPPADAASLTATTILEYSDAHPINRYTDDEMPNGAVWLKVGTKEALAVAATEHYRNSGVTMEGLNYYGDPINYGCGGKGFHGEPYYLSLRLYDVDDLATAISSGNPYDPQPYAWANFLHNEIRPGECRKKNMGMTYDYSDQLLFISEQEAGGNSDDRTVIHVFSVSDVSSSLDTTAPTVPADVSFNEGTTTLSWTASTDAVSSVSYVIYRRLPVKVSEYGTGIYHQTSLTVYPWVQTLITAGTIYAGDVYYQYTADDTILYQDYPVGLSTTNSWADTEYVSFSYHEFKVSAMDENGNESDKSGGSPAVVNSALSFGAGGSSIAIGGSSSFVIQ